MSDADHTINADGDSTRVDDSSRVTSWSFGTPGSSVGLASRSIIIGRAVSEYLSLTGAHPSLDANDFVQHLPGNCSSIRSSIIRQIEVERYLAHNPLPDASRPSKWPEMGSRIGPYYVIEELGKGGFARVYLCRQPGIGDRRVVLKVGRSVLVEAHALGQLDHPSIVPIYSAEAYADIGYAALCMPFLGRSTLCDLIDAAFLDQGAPSGGVLARASRKWEQSTDCVRVDPKALSHRKADYWDVVASIGVRLADALNYAHDRGILHGDIKPSNVLLSFAGEPLLMDFNLSGNAGLSLAARGGTLPYMPPEQLCALSDVKGSSSSRYDERSDIFSLGAVLYELLVGKQPFPMEILGRDDCAGATRILEMQAGGLTPLRSIDETIPPSLASAVERCLRLSPDERFQTADELQQALAFELRPWQRLRRRIAANKRKWITASVPVCALLLYTFALLSMRDPAEVRAVARAQQFLAAGDAERAEEELVYSVALQPNYFPARFELARLHLATGHVDQAHDAFFALVSEYHDPSSAAYVGYCFAAKGNYSAAIPWYVRAIEEGFASPAVYNNLAIEYGRGESALSTKERRAESSRLLTLAMAAYPTSPTIRLNWTLRELADVEEGADVTPHMIEVAKRLADEFPGCGVANFAAARMLALAQEDSTSVDSASRYLVNAINAGSGPSRQGFAEGEAWRELRHSPFADVIDEAISSAELSEAKGESIPRLLEPMDGVLQPPNSSGTS